jgi:dynein light chain 1, axonemal
MAMGCAKAIQEWEAKKNLRAAEAVEIKLCAIQPPITKMDQGLNQLVNCQKLSLSTNGIDKIMNLSNLKNLKILSLGRNIIRKITGLDEVGATLEQLWISYNLIEKLDGIQSCVRLHTLFISNNKIKNWEEISRLGQLSSLRNLLLVGNPIYEGYTKDDVKPQVIRRVNQIDVLDGTIVSDQVRKLAEEMKD